MYKQDNDFANYDGLRVSLISRLRKQVLAVPAPLLCSLLFAAVLALLPISAAAQCKNWDASGDWEIFQRGQSFRIKLTLKQTGRVLTGKAVHDISNTRIGERNIFKRGTVDGTINGDSFSVQIFWDSVWDSGSTGVYNAKVLPSGRLDGEAYEKASPNVRHMWHSEGVLKCLPPPITPKVIKATGRKPKPTPVQTSQPAPPPMKVPGIIASQVVFPAPANPTLGLVVLTWDGGPDHPYAEVWVKVNNRDATFVVEQGKGTRQVPVERGNTYEYILTDAGKSLSTVTVVGQ